MVEVAHGQVPVISGTGFNRAIATGFTQQSEIIGVDAVLVLPPYYPNSDEDGLAEYYQAIGDATQLPFLVYSRDWVNPSPAWVERLVGQIPSLTAWKEGKETSGGTNKSCVVLAIGRTGSVAPGTTVLPATTASEFALTRRASPQSAQSCCCYSMKLPRRLILRIPLNSCMYM